MLSKITFVLSVHLVVRDCLRVISFTGTNLIWATTGRDLDDLKCVQIVGQVIDLLFCGAGEQLA